MTGAGAEGPYLSRTKISPFFKPYISFIPPFFKPYIPFTPYFSAILLHPFYPLFFRRFAASLACLLCEVYTHPQSNFSNVRT